MLQLVNLTTFASDRALLRNVAGSDVLCVAIKATFDLSDRADLLLAAEQEPINLAPRHIGDDFNATLLRDSELTLDHAGTDVIVNACAYAPGGRAVTTVKAGVMVAGIGAYVQVTGDRVWQKSIWGAVPSEPEPFEKMPVIYERAFGGGHALDRSKDRVWDQRNPIGKGFCSDPSKLIDTPVPNIEEPGHEITSADPGEVAPIAGFAARPMSWMPRREFGGTYDADWQKNRMPHWPADLSPEYFRCAAPALQCKDTLQGHETVTLTNLTPEGKTKFKIPRLIPTVRVRLNGDRVNPPVYLRRIIVEPDLGKLVLIWRSVLDVGVQGRKIEKITVDQRPMVRADMQVSA